MFWKVFFAVLAALLAFWVIAWLFFGAALWGLASVASEGAKRASMDRVQRDQSAMDARELQMHREKLRRAVCRDGKYYVPRLSGSVTYFDPLEWRGAVVTCQRTM